MTSMVGRALSTTAMIGGGALAAGGIAGAVASRDESQASNLVVAVAGGIGLAGGATALASSGRIGSVARMVGIGATALAGVAALTDLVGGSARRQEQIDDDVRALTPEPAPSPQPVPSPTATTEPDVAPTPLTPKQGYEEAMARGRLRVDTVPDTAASLGGSDALLASIHPRYAKVFRHALNERIAPDVPVTGTVEWARVAKRVDADRDGAVTFDERMASGHMRAHSIAAYSAGVDERVRASGDSSEAARIRYGAQVVQEWNDIVQPGYSPGDSYMFAQTLLDAAEIARRPDDSADWTLLATHLEAKLRSYAS